AGRIEAAAAVLRQMETAVADADAGIAEESERRADAARRLTLEQAEAARLEDDLAALAAESRETGAGVRDQETARDRFAAEGAALEQRMATLEAEAQDLSDRLQHQARAARAAREALTDARVAVTELEGRRAGIQARLAGAERGVAASGERRRVLELEA